MAYDDAWRRLGLIAGGICFLIGAVSLGLWAFAPDRLGTDMPFLFSMTANAAAGILVLGLCACLILKGRRRAAIPLLAVVLAFGMSAMVQHLVGVDLGIDRMLVSRTFAGLPDVSGRIAPNTALCFIFVTLMLLVRAVRGHSDWFQTVLGFASFNISAAAFIGYLISLNSAHDWMVGTRMALPTAFSFVSLSLAFVFYGSPRLGIYRSVLGGLMIICTYLILLLFTYFELLNIESLYILPPGLEHEGADRRFALSALVIVSGLVFAILLVYVFQTSRQNRRIARSLREHQNRLSAVVDAATDSIVVINNRGVILSVNPACTRLFGYQEEEMVGQNVAMLMPETHGRAHDTYLRNYETTGIAKVIGLGREVEGRRKDGSLVPIDASVVRIDLSSGTIYSGTLRDISERRASERALLAANAELEEFAYRTSHDLRAPIASAIGMTAIARDMLARNETAQLDATLARMDAAFGRLDGLLQNIMVLTRARLLAEDDEPIRLSGIVHETLENLNHMEGFQSIEFDVDVDPELTFINKPSRVGVVIGNLLSNAIKYRDRAEVRSTVRVSAARAGSMVLVTIDDNGVGINPDMRVNLFRMFIRLAPALAFGSGLGLYIVKKSVEAIGGSVEYQPREKGSRFTVALPDNGWEARQDDENPFHSGRR